MKRSIAALVAIGLLASVGATAVTASSPPYTVVADGLAQPRALAFGPGGRLYVTEAGVGAGVDGQGTAQGFGYTGSVAEIRRAWTAMPRTRTLVKGLPSAVDDHGGAVGPVGVSVQGNGNILVQMALSQAETHLPSARIGRLLQVTPSGHVRTRANVGDHDYQWSTEHQDLAPNDFNPGDSNPYGVLARPGGAYVVDAGTNTLDWVAANGKITILAFFPNGAMHDATPTCVVRGPDKALYIGTLALLDSLPFLGPNPQTPPSPQAKIYRVDPKATDPSSLSTVTSVATEWASGFWPITACTADHSAIYVTQFWVPTGQAPAGDVLRVPFADPTVHQSLTSNGLLFPTGVAIGPDHRVYVSNNGLSANGQVVRLN